MFMLCSTAIRSLSQAISGHGAYISQLNRLIFLNNSLILAKGWSARLSRRRRWDFRPARGKPAARACVRAVDRREIDIQKWRKCWVFALLFPVLARKSRSTAPRIVPNPRGIDPFGARLANLTSETSSQLTPPSSGESDELGGSLKSRALPAGVPQVLPFTTSVHQFFPMRMSATA